MKGEILMPKYKNVFDIPVTTIEGVEYEKLRDLVNENKLYMFVNLASNCKNSAEYYD